jgi:hypothetical protein
MSGKQEQLDAASQGHPMAKLASSNSRSNADRIGVMVLGMHRSGTSAMARVLNLLGCDLPKALMPARDSNEAGHWESLLVYRLNDEILSSAGSTWHDWLAFNPGWQSSPKAAEFKQKALGVLQEEFGSSSLFVLKDPRICRLAPFWVDVLETAGIRPAIIMPVRNPLEVAESLALRDGIDPALGQLLWLRHVLEAEAGTRGRPRYHTSYDALLTGWAKLASAAQAELGISWPRLSPRASQEIDEFLTSRMRHHQESPASVFDNPLLSAWLRDAFDVFDRWAKNGEEAGDHAKLDRIRTELDCAAPAFARLILAGERSATKAKELDASLSETKSQLSQAEAAATAKQEQVDSLRSQLMESRAALSASEANAVQKQEQIGEIGGRLAEAQSELSKLQAEAQSLRTALETSQGELSHLQSELAQRRAEADDAAAELQTLERRFAEELEAAEQRATKAQREAERVAGELAAQRDSASAEIQKLRHDKEATEGRLNERFGEIAALTRMLVEKESEARASDEQAAWLREVSAVLMNGSTGGSLKARLAALLPAPMRLKGQKAKLKSAGIFDSEAYLAAHPDVAEAGLDPLQHYINHGMAEGRPLSSEQGPRD